MIIDSCWTFPSQEECPIRAIGPLPKIKLNRARKLSVTKKGLIGAYIPGLASLSSRKYDRPFF